jgi:outer membrane lipoprotein LolB
VNSRRAALVLGTLAAISLVAGCSITPRARGQNDIEHQIWRGRLSLQVQADVAAGQKQDQSFSAAFELQGDPTLGDLRFFTPLGSTAAAMHWSPTGAMLQARGETREFSNLAQMITSLLGTNVPVVALFAWLDGQAQVADGWQVDLSQRAQGKIQAHRSTPAPVAELRVLLDD